MATETNCVVLSSSSSSAKDSNAKVLKKYANLISSTDHLHLHQHSMGSDMDEKKKQLSSELDLPQIPGWFGEHCPTWPGIIHSTFL